MAFESFFHLVREIQGKLTSGVLGGEDPHQIAYLRNLQKEKKQGNVLYVPLDQLEVVVLDIETTGFFPDQGDEILSIGAVKVKGCEIIQDQEFYSLIRYEKELSPQITQLTGISSGELKEAPILSDVLIQFFAFAGNSTLVAHHSNHEKSFLQNASWKLFRAPFKHRIVDTSFLYRIAEQNTKLLRLEDFCQYNDIPIVNRHHALGDAKLAAQLWGIYLNKVQQLGCNTLHDVYERIAKM